MKLIPIVLNFEAKNRSGGVRVNQNDLVVLSTCIETLETNKMKKRAEVRSFDKLADEIDNLLDDWPEDSEAGKATEVIRVSEEQLGTIFEWTKNPPDSVRLIGRVSRKFRLAIEDVYQKNEDGEFDDDDGDDEAAKLKSLRKSDAPVEPESNGEVTGDPSQPPMEKVEADA